jgi:integrase
MPEAITRRGRRGDGTTYRTKDGRYRAAITVPDAATGIPVRRYLSARSDKEIRRKLREARTEATVTGRTPTVAQWCERWLSRVEARVRPATLALYRQNVRHHIVPAVGRAELARLLPSDVEDMTTGMIRAGKAKSTAALARRVLVIALSDAMRDGIVVRNVAQLAKPPRSAEPTRRALTGSEVGRFLEAIANDPLEPFVALAVSTGLRRSELLALRWSDVNAGTLRVSRSLARAATGGYAVAEPKSKRSVRTIVLPALARQALDHQRVRQDVEKAAAGSAWQDVDGSVFTDAIGRPWHPETMTTMYRALVARSGIGPLRLHDLRHTAATLALSAGVPVRDVSDALGHASPSITLDIYGQSVAEGPRRVADALDRAFDAES